VRTKKRSSNKISASEARNELAQTGRSGCKCDRILAPGGGTCPISGNAFVPIMSRARIVPYIEQVKRDRAGSAAPHHLSALPDKEDIPRPPSAMAVRAVVNFGPEAELVSVLVYTPCCLIIQ
jgi:hypothetical protein